MRQSDIKKLKDGLHRASRSLYLSVSGNGTYRSWVFRKTVNGRVYKFGLGSATCLTLSQAIDKTEGVLGKISAGIPVVEIFERKKPEKVETHTLKEIVYIFIDSEAKRLAYKSTSKTVKLRKRAFEMYIPDRIKRKNVYLITQEEIVEALSPVCESTVQVGDRLRSTIEKAFDFAKVKKWFKGDNPARWAGCLEYLMPRCQKQKTNRKALTLEEMKRAVILLREEKFTNEATQKAILFGMLTATRLVEFSKSKWNEIDWEKRTWSVDPSHRKGKHTEPFVVPLSDQAIELLKSIPRATEYIFTTPKTPYPNLTIITPRLQRITKTDCTMHGCRSTFRDWCAETGVERDVAEVSLSHRVGENETERSYYRTKFFEKRRKVMQDWADEIAPKNIDIPT